MIKAKVYSFQLTKILNSFCRSKLKHRVFSLSIQLNISV